MVHLEFVVPGPPVSHQTGDRANLKRWKAAVKAAAAKRWASAKLTGRLKFTLLNFHEGDNPPTDDDNMLKPIRDALNGFVYEDDKQIRHSETIQRPANEMIPALGASAVLLAAFSRGVQFVYVRIEDLGPLTLPSEPRGPS